PLKTLAELGEHLGLDVVEPVLAVLLVRDREGVAHARRRRRLDGLERVRLVVGERREVLRRLRSTSSEVTLGLDECADERLGRLETLSDDVLGRSRGALVLDEVPRAL